jgi:hypothetical protein
MPGAPCCLMPNLAIGGAAPLPAPGGAHRKFGTVVIARAAKLEIESGGGMIVRPQKKGGRIGPP